jgi:putative DNA primase/helicase
VGARLSQQLAEFLAPVIETAKCPAEDLTACAGELRRMTNIDFAALLAPVARRLLGDPNKQLSTRSELRFGTHGSLAVVVAGDKRGTWFDHEANEGGGVLELLRSRLHLAGKQALDWLRAEGLLPPREERARVVATYGYQDADGKLLFEVVRMAPKAFRQRRPNAAGGWIWNLHGVERVPYCLPELLRAASHAPVFICEGEKDCDALRERCLIATTNPEGSGKWKASMSTYLCGRDVVILPDNDGAGEKHAADVAAKLHGIARSIRVLRLPGLPNKGDASDWLAAGGTADELERLAAEAPSYEPGAMAEPGKAIIQVEPGQIDVLATRAEDALITAKLPVFQRGGDLVRPTAWSVPASDERTTLAAGLRPIKAPAMIDLLAQAATWTRYNGRRKKHCPIDPPGSVASVVLSRCGSWRVPRIAGTITTPTMRRDGSIFDAPGFDPATRLYHLADPDLRMPPIGTLRADAEQALTRLIDLLAGFPFVTAVDRSVGLSGLISPVVRGAVGMVPMHALTAPTAGSGKSHFVDVAAAIATGRVCPVASAGRDETETEKRLGGLLLAGFAVISLDNLSDQISGDLLCQAVERPVIRLRPLGTSEISEIESRATLFATGNNLIVAGDMTRRTLLGHLDAQMERPEERQFRFDPVQRVISDRGTYVAACLSIPRAYLLAGCPGKLPQLASFGAWSDLVRSALVWLGCADPAQSIQEARRSDPVLDTLRQVLDAWRRCFDKEGQTVRQVMGAIAGYDPTAEKGRALDALRMALAPVATKGGQIDANKLGYYLRSSKDRIVGNLRFAIVGEPHGVAEWAVTDV